MTQQNKILRYMENHGSITPMEAFRELNCTRLAAQVFELKGKGYPIVTTMIETVNSEGETKRYASYSFK